MGRPEWSNRKEVERCRELSIFKLKQGGAFRNAPGIGWNYSWTNSLSQEKQNIGFSVHRDCEGLFYLILDYTITGSLTEEVTPYHYRVDIAATPCHFGGVRHWFLCPLSTDHGRCYRQVGKLYLPPRARYFGCRQCYNLTYRSQKEHNKCLDPLMRNPALLRAGLKSGDPLAALAALEVWRRLSF